MGELAVRQPHLGRETIALLGRIVDAGEGGLPQDDIEPYLLVRLLRCGYVRRERPGGAIFVATPAGCERARVEAILTRRREEDAARREIIRGRIQTMAARLEIDRPPMPAMPSLRDLPGYRERALPPMRGLAPPRTQALPAPAPRLEHSLRATPEDALRLIRDGERRAKQERALPMIDTSVPIIDAQDTQVVHVGRLPARRDAEPRPIELAPVDDGPAPVMDIRPIELTPIDTAADDAALADMPVEAAGHHRLAMAAVAAAVVLLAADPLYHYAAPLLQEQALRVQPMEPMKVADATQAKAPAAGSPFAAPSRVAAAAPPAPAGKIAAAVKVAESAPKLAASLVAPPAAAATSPAAVPRHAHEPPHVIAANTQPAAAEHPAKPIAHTAPANPVLAMRAASSSPARTPVETDRPAAETRLQVAAATVFVPYRHPAESAVAADPPHAQPAAITPPATKPAPLAAQIADAGPAPARTAAKPAVVANATTTPAVALQPVAPHSEMPAADIVATQPLTVAAQPKPELVAMQTTSIASAMTAHTAPELSDTRAAAFPAVVTPAVATEPVPAKAPAAEPAPSDVKTEPPAQAAPRQALLQTASLPAIMPPMAHSLLLPVPPPAAPVPAHESHRSSHTAEQQRTARPMLAVAKSEVTPAAAAQSDDRPDTLTRVMSKLRAGDAPAELTVDRLNTFSLEAAMHGRAYLPPGAAREATNARVKSPFWSP